MPFIVPQSCNDRRRRLSGVFWNFFVEAGRKRKQ
jgi:hypothetical protein